MTPIQLALLEARNKLNSIRIIEEKKNKELIRQIEQIEINKIEEEEKKDFKEANYLLESIPNELENAIYLKEERFLLYTFMVYDGDKMPVYETNVYNHLKGLLIKEGVSFKENVEPCFSSDDNNYSSSWKYFQIYVYF